MINLSYHMMLLLSNEIESERSIRMYELSVFQQGGVDVIDSRSVAEAIEKPHSDLMKSIRNYAEFLNAGDFSSVDFFIPSTYTDSKGEERPCYLLTKKGCDMVANKMTGEKGVLFTAAYVTAFEKMRTAASQFASLSPQLQALIGIEMRQQEQERRMDELSGRFEQHEKRMDNIAAAWSAPFASGDNWQESANHAINSAVQYFGLNYQKFRHDLYEELERTAGVGLQQRLTRLQNRMAASGATATQRRAVNKLTIIAQDRKLRAIFEGILRCRITELNAARSN